MNHQKRMTLEEYLTTYFSKNQGIRLGETTVVSRKVHGNDSRSPGVIRIYIDTDAGQHYLNAPEDNMVIHMDVFHEPANLDPVFVARNINQGIEYYFLRLHEENRTEYPKPKVAELTKLLSENIFIKTSEGQGSVFDLASKRVLTGTDRSKHSLTHVHLLFSIEPKFYDSIVFIADNVEQAIINQGFEIRRVENLIHCKKNLETRSGEGIGISLPGFNSPDALKHRIEQNRLQIIMNLASDFGTIEDAVRFLESLTTKGSFLLKGFAKKHNDRDLKQTLMNLTNLDLIKKRTFGYALTYKGKEVRDFIRIHQKELEAQLRKSIRRYQIVRHNYKTYRNSQLKSRKNQITDHKKIIGWNDKSWLSDIAVPETIVSASARSFLNKQPYMTIKKEDIKLYGKKSFAPIDTCLSIDCSGSMVGDKIKAVSYLAEHFLLTAKEKMGVVAFQETEARLVVPFTKSYQKLEEGLRSIEPHGMTPLATGIITSIEAIKKRRARNPLMVLITDGIPNYPLWTVDARKDALKAAELIAENKIRLVCIGVIPNEGFLKELAAIGRGNLYIVDELDKNSLLDVVTKEWQDYKYTI